MCACVPTFITFQLGRLGFARLHQDRWGVQPEFNMFHITLGPFKNQFDHCFNKNKWWKHLLFGLQGDDVNKAYLFPQGLSRLHKLPLDKSLDGKLALGGWRRRRNCCSLWLVGLRVQLDYLTRSIVKQVRAGSLRDFIQGMCAIQKEHYAAVTQATCILPVGARLLEQVMMFAVDQLLLLEEEAMDRSHPRGRAAALSWMVWWWCSCEQRAVCSRWRGFEGEACWPGASVGQSLTVAICTKCFVMQKYAR